MPVPDEWGNACRAFPVSRCEIIATVSQASSWTVNKSQLSVFATSFESILLFNWFELGCQSVAGPHDSQGPGDDDPSEVLRCREFRLLPARLKFSKASLYTYKPAVNKNSTAWLTRPTAGAKIIIVPILTRRFSRPRRPAQRPDSGTPPKPGSRSVAAVQVAVSKRLRLHVRPLGGLPRVAGHWRTAAVQSLCGQRESPCRSCDSLLSGTSGLSLKEILVARDKFRVNKFH